MATGIFVPASVVGTDGNSPVRDTDSLWREWDMSDIYLGREGKGKYVPKVRDYITETIFGANKSAQRRQYVVIAVDETTCIPEYIPLETVLTEEDATGEGLFGINAAGTNRNTYKAYFNNRVKPNQLAFDARLRTTRLTTTKAKVYFGTDYTDESHCISKVLDNTGAVVGNVIYLKSVIVEYSAYKGMLEPIKDLINYPNQAINFAKSVPACSSSRNLRDGDIVTIVFFDDMGNVDLTQQCTVEVTNSVPEVNSSKRYIRDLRLICPWQSADDPDLIEYPINVPLKSLFLFAEVVYNSGRKIYPIDGVKVSTIGLEQFMATRPGQDTVVTLVYNLNADEVVISGVVADNGVVRKNIHCVVTPQDTMYSVALLPYPVWIDSVNGYRLKWFLYTMDRSVYYDVTSLVRFNSGKPVFDPLGYGVVQNLSVRLNLADVSGLFKSYIHTQNVDVVLLGEGDGVAQSNWKVGFWPNQSTLYGDDVYGTYTHKNGENIVNISLNLNDPNIWLDKLYYNTKPMVNKQLESVAPVPTHFIVHYPAGTLEFPFERWDTDITIPGNMGPHETLFIQFIKRTIDYDQQLTMAAIQVHRVN